MIFWVVIGAVVLSCILFFFAYQRPLTEDEIGILARRRRGKAIQRYYFFDRGERQVNLQFKKSMAANGSFYAVNEALGEFPALAAGLLKYKKHEWMIVAFEADQHIDKLWLNKGPDRSQVNFGISLPSVKNIAAQGKYSSVLVFHNHPNSDPSFYSTAGASARDKEAAAELARELGDVGVNLFEFVCERGRHHEYWRSILDTFLPVANFSAELQSVSGLSGSQNFSLHWERIFKS